MIRKILSTHKVKPHNDRAFYQNECRKLMNLYQKQAEYLDWDCGYLPVYQKKKILLFEGGTVGHKLFCRFGARSVAPNSRRRSRAVTAHAP